jgi:hypothetical protein
MKSLIEKAKSLSSILKNPITGDVYTGSKKKQFKTVATSFLKSLACDLELEDGSYDVRFNAGGPAVSGEATLHGSNIYVQIFQSGYFRTSNVLYRTCEGQRDFTGGYNCFGNVDDFVNTDLILKIKALTIGKFVVI